jgi:DNA-binding transcriptional LysR family regulator
MDDYSLEQFRVFLAVVDNGGFAAAARKLGKAQSVITYSIRRMEEQTGLILFDRSHYRPKLTSAGTALLPRARLLMDNLEDFHTHAKSYADGIESEVSIVINEFADMSMVIKSLQAMHQAYPSVRVKLLLKPFGEDLELVRSGKALLGVVPEINAIGNEFSSRQIATHQLVAVAAPQHSLAKIRETLNLAHLRGHTQIVWSRESAALSSADLGIHSLDTWHVTDLGVKLKLLINGLGWGSMPEHYVKEFLADGRLVSLEMESWEGRDKMPNFTTSIVRLKKTRLGPAAKIFINHFFKN